MNKVFLIGRLTRDPQATTFDSGSSCCRFSIAVDRYSRDGENKADFINITTWNALAQNCVKYLTKGSKVAVCGQIQTRTYEVDGQKRYATDIVADDVEFLNRAGDNQSAGGERQSAPAPKKTSELKPVDDEGLPF